MYPKSLQIELTRARLLIAQLAIYYVGIAPLLFSLFDSPHGDVQLYHETTKSLLMGQLPYAEIEFEYPPYALIWFLIPALGGNLLNFHFLFALQLLLLDMAIKIGLLIEGERWSKGWAALLPIALFSIHSLFLNHFYLQRMDLIPAGLTVAALLAFSRQRLFLAGLFISIGAGTKLYPALFGLPLLALAWNRRQAAPLIKGALAGLAPLIAMLPFLPWWQFLTFHSDRGFEVEALYAAILWLLHFFIDLDLNWTWVHAWQEVKGPDADPWVPCALVLFATTVIGSTLLATWRIYRDRTTDLHLGYLAKVSLFVLLPFVAFNIVLSPQYLIWLGVLAALGVLWGNRFWMLLIPVAAILTPVFYPSPQFSSGLTLLQTIVLLTRDLSLVAVWLALGKEILARRSLTRFEECQ